MACRTSGLLDQWTLVQRDTYAGVGRPRTSIEVCSTSIEVRLQPHFGLIGHSLVVSPFICNILFHWSNSQSLSNDNQATKLTGVLTLLDTMLSTVKLRVQQEVNIYQFEVDNIYCQLKEITNFRKDSSKY